MIAKKLSRLRFLALIAVFLLGVSGPASAQEETDTSGDDLKTDLLRWKMFNLHPRIATSFLYDDNIILRETNELSDFEWIVSPGISAVAGDPTADGAKLLSIDYEADVHTFLKYDQFNAVDHLGSVDGILRFAKLSLGLRGSYGRLSTPEANLGIRVERTVYNVAGTSRYEISPKTSVEVNAGFNKTEYSDARLIGSHEFSNQNWINNQISAKVNLGLGIGVGFLEQDRGPSQVYERALLRAIYVLTGKLNLKASAGVEWRQYDSFESQVAVLTGFPTNTAIVLTNVTEDSSARFSPIFDIGADYRPIDGTTINVTLYRRDQNSPTVAGYNYISTGFQMGVQQRFLERFTATLNGSLENSSYHADLETRNLDREDFHYSVGAGVNAAITSRWHAGLAYLHRGSDSDEDFGIIYQNNQVILRTSYTF